MEQKKNVYFDAINSILMTAKIQLGELEYNKLKEIYIEDVYIYFSELKKLKKLLESKLLIWRSYNARMLTSYLTLVSSNSIERYSYSGIISAMTENTEENKIVLFNENKYRESMVKCDIQKAFLNKSDRYFKSNIRNKIFVYK